MKQRVAHPFDAANRRVETGCAPRDRRLPS